MIGLLWYVAWHAAVLAVGWILATAHAGEPGVYLGAGIAVIAGPAFAQLSKLARRLSVERYSVRVELYDFRFTWVWTTFWFGGSLVAGWAVADALFASYNMDISILLAGILGMLAGGWFGRIAGRKHEHLRVDINAGVVEYVGGKTVACPLAELGRFEIVKHKEPYDIRKRHRTEWFRLVAPGLPDVLLANSVYPKGVERLRARLQARFDELRDISAVRRVLAETTDGTSYRGVNLRDALRAAVDDPARLRGALTALAADPDPEIQRKARALP